MKRKLFAAAALLLFLGVPASAHRLDEYLQATLISLAKERVQVVIRMQPGVSAAAAVLSLIDSDGDAVISPLEQQI